MREYKISVIVPIYNSEKYLDKCIKSIINQTYKNLEIILVNDGSSDGSLAICNMYNNLDDRIKIIDTVNEGVVSARKKGVRDALGDYVTFVDSDDWIEEDTYSRLLDELIDEDVLCYGMIEDYGYKSIPKSNNIKDGVYGKEAIMNCIFSKMLCNGDFFEFGVLPNLVCKLFKRELFLLVLDKVTDKVTVGEDVDFTYHILAIAKNMKVVDFKPYHYMQLNGSLVRNAISMLGITKLFDDLRRIEMPENMKNQWNKQLAAYFAFLLLLKNTSLMVKYIPYFREKLSGKRIIIYGAGNYGQSVRCALEGIEDTHIVGMVDRDWETISEYVEGVSSIDGVLGLEYDVIYIAILNECTCSCVKNMLLQKEVVESKITYLGISDIEKNDILEIFKEYYGEVDV